MASGRSPPPAKIPSVSMRSAFVVVGSRPAFARWADRPLRIGKYECDHFAHFRHVGPFVLDGARIVLDRTGSLEKDRAIGGAQCVNVRSGNSATPQPDKIESAQPHMQADRDAIGDDIGADPGKSADKRIATDAAELLGGR